MKRTKRPRNSNRINQTCSWVPMKISYFCRIVIIAQWTWFDFSVCICRIGIRFAEEETVALIFFRLCFYHLYRLLACSHFVISWWTEQPVHKSISFWWYHNECPNLYLNYFVISILIFRIASMYYCFYCWDCCFGLLHSYTFFSFPNFSFLCDYFVLFLFSLSLCLLYGRSGFLPSFLFGKIINRTFSISNDVTVLNQYFHLKPTKMTQYGMRFINRIDAWKRESRTKKKQHGTR